MYYIDAVRFSFCVYLGVVDIRTLYILFLLSFVDSSTPTAVKAAFLEQRRDTLLPVFKGLFQDSHAVVRRVLECCWTGIWCDPKIKRTAKVSLFNEQTVHQVSAHPRKHRLR
jgi:nucleolar pre-ribosomal-associated protein 1